MLSKSDGDVNSLEPSTSDRISGIISCFDRVLFKGYLTLGWPGAMEGLIASRGLLIKDFKNFVEEQSRRISQHAEGIAGKHNRPFLSINGRCRKDDHAREIAEQDGITSGLVCVMRILEPCQSFKMIPGKGRPQLVNAQRKCLCFDDYFIDPEFGLMHVRIQSWFPLVIQVCLNGHEWLALKMDKHGIAYRQVSNAFVWIEDCLRAQRFADKFEKKNWPRVLSALARRINPLMKDVLEGMEYYWVMDQVEYATDVMFHSADVLKGPYEQFLEHATLCFGAEDVLTFLGRKLHGHFQGEVLTDMKKKRHPGARVKHRMKENWIKMYDKHGCVLRVETVINNPREFKVRRQGVRQREEVMGWFPMAKGVKNMPRYREVALAANSRYLSALTAVAPLDASRQEICRLGHRVRQEDRSRRALNPANEDDVKLLAAVMRGEHLLQGFRNKDIREQLYEPAANRRDGLRQSQKVGRLLMLLRAHKLIAKVPRSRRWQVTRKGHAAMTTILVHHHKHYPLTHSTQAT